MKKIVSKNTLAALFFGLLAGCSDSEFTSTVSSVQPNTVTTLAGTAGVTGSADATGAAASFRSPYGLAVDSNGNVYIGDYANRIIRKITSAGVVTTLAGTVGVIGSADGIGTAATFTSPTGIAVDSSGTLYVADTGSHAVRKITNAGVVTTLAGLSANLSNFYGVAVDGGGNVYAADTGNHTIRKITSSGVVTTLAGTTGVTGSSDGAGAAASFSSPSSIAIDSSGNLYVTDSGNNTIRKITSAGVVTTIAGTVGSSGSSDGTGTAAKFNSPDYITIDASGNLYVSDSGNHIIRKISPAGVVTTIAGTAGSSGSTDGVGTAAKFNNPEGIAIDTSGNLYVADSGNRVIRKIAAAQ